MVSTVNGSMWQYSQGTVETFRLSQWRMAADSSSAHFWACPPMGVPALTQTLSQWPPEETQNTNSSTWKPHPSSQCLCPCFLAAVKQHLDQRVSCGPVQSLCRQWCAGRAASGESSRCLWSFLLVFAVIRGCAHCRFAEVPSGSTVLGQVYCPWAFNMHQVFTAKILTAFCARAFYMMLQMSLLSLTQTFRLLWI